MSSGFDFDYVSKIVSIAKDYTSNDLINASRLITENNARSDEVVMAIATAIGDDTLSRIASTVESQALWDEIISISEFAADWIIQAANSWYLLCGFSASSYHTWMTHLVASYSSYQNPITNASPEDIDTCTFSDELFDSMANNHDLMSILIGNRWLVFLFTLQPALSDLIIELKSKRQKQ